MSDWYETTQASWLSRRSLGRLLALGSFFLCAFALFYLLKNLYLIFEGQGDISPLLWSGLYVFAATLVFYAVIKMRYDHLSWAEVWFRIRSPAIIWAAFLTVLTGMNVLETILLNGSTWPVIKSFGVFVCSTSLLVAFAMTRRSL
ncbi:MAG: hypothetical protein A2808_02305 [Candidatus Moranbacteria bacterium RIFCSPHIGHO2_01_FULL_55_24]|nr:MAG: hypothetical protein A2808_02305 [Candidatus Moranbacteria bacterium RIFCSPHIGHO2_01_FULL_55_24]